MSVFRSDKNIYVQIIDDNIGKTLVSASTLEKKIKTKIKKTTNKEAANEVGILIAEKAKEKGIEFINISPLRSDIPKFTDAKWLQIRPNSDTALMLGLAHSLVIENLHDKNFLSAKKMDENFHFQISP